MAHGQSIRQVRRAAWLVVACSLATGCLTGCTGPDKETLDPATKQKLLGIAPPPGAKAGTGNASVDQRFNRTTPIRLPDPQLGNTNPAPVNPAPGIGNTPTGGVGTITAPTMPGGNPAVMQPQSIDPVVRTGGFAPQPPAPVGLDPVMPPTGGLPVPGGATLPTVGGPVMPGGALLAAPAPLSPNLDQLPPLGGGGPPAPVPLPSPAPGPSMPGPNGPLPAVPSITDLPPLVPPLGSDRR